MGRASVRGNPSFGLTAGRCVVAPDRVDKSCLAGHSEPVLLTKVFEPDRFASALESWSWLTFTLDNITKLDFVVALQISGQLIRQLRDLPAGAQVSEFTVDGRKP